MKNVHDFLQMIPTISLQMVVILGLEVLMLILVIIGGNKWIKYKRLYLKEKIHCGLITKRNHELIALNSEYVRDHFEIGGMLSEKESENERQNKNIAGLTRNIADLKHENKILVIDYAYQFCKKNNDGYTTKNVSEMLETLYAFLKK